MLDLRDSGEHVRDEPLMARHVDERDLPAVDLGPREAEVDGQTAALLLGEAVGPHAGEPLHQRGLAMVDVAGGRYDIHARAASTSSSSSSGATVQRQDLPLNDFEDRADHQNGYASLGHTCIMASDSEASPVTIASAFPGRGMGGFARLLATAAFAQVRCHNSGLRSDDKTGRPPQVSELSLGGGQEEGTPPAAG